MADDGEAAVETQQLTEKDEAWIDCDKIDAMLTDKLELMCTVDGSEQSMRGLEMVVQGFMQSDRNTSLKVYHFYDDKKDYLPPRWRKDAVESTCITKCTSYLVERRYQVILRKKPAKPKVIGEELCELVEANKASFIVLGFKGRSGRKDKHIVGSNVMEVMQRGKCSAVIMRSEEPEELAVNRPTKWIVSASLNVAATKAFLDALRLSKKGDEIQVVYVRPFLEPHSDESIRTQKLRDKYAGLFSGIQDSQMWPSGKVAKFGDRDLKLVLAPQGRGEGIAQALVRHAENVEADFVCVGTNALRVARGKPYLGSVSLDIIMEFDGNIMVSNYLPGEEKKKSTMPKLAA